MMDDIYNILDNQEQSTPKQEPQAVAEEFDKEAWAEKKKIEREFAYATMEEAAGEVGTKSDVLIQYLDMQARFDRYSVGNVLLIMSQSPEATRLKDYDGWKEAGTGVRPGQTGIIILEPGNEYQREDGTTATSFNTKKVFDVSQTFDSNKSQPQVSRDERYIMKALVKSSVVPIKAVDNLSVTTLGAFYDDKQKCVLVRRGLENSEFMQAVTQELAHANLARKGNYDRSEKGFEAYCVSYMMCHKNGFDTSAYEFKELPKKFSGMDAGDVRNTLAEIRDILVDMNGGIQKSFEQAKSTKQKDHER